MTLEDVFIGLSERMDTITDELVKVSKGLDSVQYRVSSIEAGMVDVELKNGGGRIIKQPRQQIIQQAYDTMKPGGVLDQKFNECREMHNPAKQSMQNEKKLDKIWKWGTRAVVLILVVAAIIVALDWDKLVK